jgi:undecaprenyl-diphosphatase
VALVVLTVEVTSGTGIVSADHRVLEWVNRHQVRWLNRTCNVTTDVLSPPVDVIAVLLYAAFKKRVRRRSLVVVLLVMSASVIGLKRSVGRPTPLHPSRFYGDYPSGHTAGFLICAGAAILLTDLATRRAWQLWAVVAVATVAIGASLIYIDVHWLSDILASLALSAIVLWGVAVTRPASGPRSPS